MDTLKKFAKYIIWIVIFYFLSNLLIFIGLNANYSKINSNANDVPSQVEIDQAEATLVNGRIRGKIKNDGEMDLNGKNMKVDLFSPRGVLLGTEYVDIKDLPKGESDDFELFFKAQDVDSYKISFVDKLENADKTSESDNDDIANGFFKKFKINTEFMKRKLTAEEVFWLIFLLALFG